MSLVQGAEAIAQHVRIRTQFWLDEWFLNRREGLPFQSIIFAKGITAAVIQNLMTEAILETPGVETVKDFSVDINAKKRTVSVSFLAVTDTGAVLDFSEPFILGGA